jgi:hypothetical protein
LRCRGISSVGLAGRHVVSDACFLRFVQRDSAMSLPPRGYPAQESAAV